jgi:hypothetical protein
VNDEKDIMKKPPQNIINERQAIIDELKIKNGFQLKFRIGALTLKSYLKKKLMMK